MLFLSSSLTFVLGISQTIDVYCDDFIWLKVTGELGGVVDFKVKGCTKFGTIHAVFCARKAIEREYVRLYFEGELLGPDHTPDDFEMEDGAVSCRDVDHWI